MVEVARCQRSDPRGKLERLGMRELEGRRVVELSRLRLDRLDDRVAVMPGVGAPQAGRTVEQFAAVGGDVEHVLGADDQPRLFLEGAVGGEGDPVRLEVVGGGCRFGLWEGHFESPCGSYPFITDVRRWCCRNCLICRPTMADKSDKKSKLKARLPRGLADRGPAEIAATREMVEKIRVVFERYGFEPLETPAIEYTDALGKFLPDQDRPNEGVFSFQDDDEQWLSLRYDLTAPLARYVAENFQHLAMPFRSYRAGYVFRNEKPGPGRFRQFMQFDADTVGSASMAADAEMCMLAADTMEALGIARGSYVVKVNNRKVLDGVLDSLGIAPDKRLTTMRAIDKLDRLGVEGVRLLLGKGRKDESGDFTKGAELGDSQIETIVGAISGASAGGSGPGETELAEIEKLVGAAGYGDRVKIDKTVV